MQRNWAKNVAIKIKAMKIIQSISFKNTYYLIYDFTEKNVIVNRKKEVENKKDFTIDEILFLRKNNFKI